MDFELSADQVALRDELRRFLTKRVDHDSRWAAAGCPGGVDRDLWRELAGLGVFGICTPETEGGVGLGLADATVVFEELGRAAVPGPTIATCVAAELVPGAVDGSTVVGVVDVGAAADGPVVVEHLEGLDVLLVLQNDRLQRVDPPSGTPLPRPLDPLTPVSVVDPLPTGHVLPDREEAARLMRNGQLLTAAFQIGLAQAAVDMGTDYAGQRQQFGKIIGSFQAVKHLLADAAVATDVARAGVHAAAVSIDEAGDEALDDTDTHGRTMSVAAARAVASAAAQHATEACIQVHGGMGFTWELDAHLFLKRSLALDTTFGTATASLDDVAATL